MFLNNSPIVHALGSLLDRSQLQGLRVPTPRRRVVSEPCLPERLPSNGTSIPSTVIFQFITHNQGFMEREATDLAPKAILRQLRRSPTPPSPDSDARDDEPPQRTRRASVSSVISSLTTKSTKSPTRDDRMTPWAEPQVGLLIVRDTFLDHRAHCLAI